MALPADFDKIFGSTFTGGLTPIPDVDYAKGWEYVGSNPPTKNDFSYLQNLSDLKAKWLYENNSGRLVRVLTFTSSGTYIPTEGIKFVIVEGIGGGGAGGGAPATASGNVGGGAGGNAGGYGKGQFTADQIGASQTVTIGAGGIGTTGSGGNGGDTSLGELVSFFGGRGAQSAGNAAPPLIGGNGNVPATCSRGANIIRGYGAISSPFSALAASVGYSGAGASSPYGSGGGIVNNTSNGAAASGFGSGGSGALALSGNASARTGGNGAPGFITIYEYA